MKKVLVLVGLIGLLCGCTDYSRNPVGASPIWGNDEVVTIATPYSQYPPISYLNEIEARYKDKYRSGFVNSNYNIILVRK